MSDLQDEKPLITYQTGENESFLIGTEEQLLSFAQAIVEAVKSAKPDDFFGEKVLVSGMLRDKLDSKAEIRFDEVVVVESNEQKKAVFYKIYNS